VHNLLVRLHISELVEYWHTDELKVIV